MWAQSLLGRPEATQVRGEDLTTDLFAFAEKRGVPIGIFGGTEALLLQLRRVLRARFPRLEIAYLESPPFRTITEEEDRKHVAAINSSGARILFVGLGCPKQERWMAAHKDRLSVVMLGVGAAFDFIAGSKRAAPRWIQRIGLEWIFRLCNEPKRLWKRYLNHNPRFLWQFGKYFLAWKLTGARSCGPEK